MCIIIIIIIIIIFSTMFVRNLLHSKNNCAKHLFWLSCNVPVILVRFLWNLCFLDRYSKNTQISNFMKIRPVEAELFHVDRWTDGETWRS